MSENCNILLSGSTGILGSHILFELLHQYASGLLTGRIGLIIRPSNTIHLKKENRIDQILDIPYLPESLRSFTKEELLKPIFIIYKSIHEVREKDFPANFCNVIFIHAAASVNLSSAEEVYSEIEHHNYEGTVSLMRHTATIVKKFVFISTAYVTGHREGTIGHDLLNFENCCFRNPYENFKNRTEKDIVEFCLSKQIQWQILRPSIICGRLLDPPLYFIPRFSVFYLIAKFFYLLKKYSLSDPAIRLFAPNNIGLNIVPVDYVSKSIVRLAFTNIEQINLVHSKNFCIKDLFEIGFQEMRYKNFSILSEPFVDKTFVEKRYEKIIDPQLLPYIETPEHSFDTSYFRQIMNDFPEPDITSHFDKLIRFAIDNQFKAIY